MSPLRIFKEWLAHEKTLGSPDPERMVLATSENNIPASRIVAIRDINEEGILFFTQRGSRKVKQLSINPLASITLWLPLQQREVVLDGHTRALTSAENKMWWDSLPRDRQLRFHATAATSGKVINSSSELDDKFQLLTKQFLDQDIPMSEFYCGFYFIAESVYFYTLGTDKCSEIIQYNKHSDDSWLQQMISP